MKSIVLLTSAKTGKKIIIGTESIIDASEGFFQKEFNGPKHACTVIRSREAMATTNYVKETPEEIYKQANNET